MPAPIAVPGDPGRRLPRPPIFQVQPLADPEVTSVDEMPTRQQHDSSAALTHAAEPREAGARNVHAAFAQTELRPFAPSPATQQADASFSPAPPQAWLEPEHDNSGYPAPPASSPGFPAALGATTLQGLGEAERIALQGGHPHAFSNAAGQGFIPPRVMDEMSHTTADLSGRKLLLPPIAIGAAAGLLVTVVVVGVILLAREPSPAPAGTSASVVIAHAPPASTPAPPATLVASAPRASSSLPAPTEADAKAQAALAKLKMGIEQCVKSTIHVLPGASPAVPSSITWLKSGPYESLRRDWSSPFFSCTGFKIEEPMPFMIQWQVDVPNEKGTAVAWLDPDGDGVVDRAYGFKATLVQRDKVEFGPIEVVEASRKVQRAH